MQNNQLKIVSGGQTGVDRGALDAALESDVPCGGWCPKGRRAEDGPIDPRYPLTEMESTRFIDRTRQNVIDSDGTLIIYFNELEGGSARTRDFCEQEAKPYLLIDAGTNSMDDSVVAIIRFIGDHDIRTLNVAGPRASKMPEAHDITQQIVGAVLAQLHDTTAATY